MAHPARALWHALEQLSRIPAILSHLRKIDKYLLRRPNPQSSTFTFSFCSSSNTSMPFCHRRYRPGWKQNQQQSQHSRGGRFGSSNQHGGSFWRNPFVVFVLTFTALGTLRFRVRTKQAATALFKRTGRGGGLANHHQHSFWRTPLLVPIADMSREFGNVSKRRHISKRQGCWMQMMSSSPRFSDK